MDEEVVLEARAKSLQNELVAKQVETTFLSRSWEPRRRELSDGRTWMPELRRGDVAIPRGK